MEMFKKVAIGIFALVVMSVNAEPSNSDALKDTDNFYKSLETRHWLQTSTYRGSWHADGGKSYHNGSLYKYSGPTSTYTAKHAPLAVESGNFTYFIVNGQSEHYPWYAGQGYTRYPEYQVPSVAVMVGKYDNVNKKLYPPITIHVKGTSDSHDNAIINIDDKGYLYVFISGRNDKRGGLIYKSASPDDISNFSLVYSDKYTVEALDYDCDSPYVVNMQLCSETYRGFSYPQAWWSNGKFILLHTIYLPLTYNDALPYKSNPTYMRATYVTTVTPTENGVAVAKPKKLVAVKGDYTKGHYSISKERNGTIGLAFNVTFKDKTINPIDNKPVAPHDSRSNLYFMYSKNGDDWFNMNGDVVVQNILSTGSTLNNGITKPSQLASVAVREYHNPITGNTNENWCRIAYGEDGYVCRRVYLKDVDFTTDSSGVPNRVEILYVANRSIESDSTVEFGAFPSPNIHSSNIYLARHFYLNSSSGWQAERIKDNSGNDVVDHNYSSGTLKIDGVKSYIISPASTQIDGYAGQDQVQVFINNDGSQGNWFTSTGKYYPSLPSTLTANYVRSVHNASSDFQVIWSEGPKKMYTPSQGDNLPIKVFIGDLTNKKLELPSTSTIPSNGVYMPMTPDVDNMR